MKMITKAIPHISIILSGMLIVLFIIDRFFNSAMGFLDNDGAKILMFLLSVTAIASASMLIAQQRRNDG